MKFYSNVLLFIIVTKLNDNEYQLGINFRGEIIFFKVVITFWKDFEMKIAKNSPRLPLFYKILSFLVEVVLDYQLKIERIDICNAQLHYKDMYVI